MIRSLFFMILMVMTVASLPGCNSQSAESVTPCDMGAVPVQIIRIAEGPVTPLSEAEIYSTVLGFSAFATDVVGHLATRLGREKLCLDSTESKNLSLLQFAPRPVNSERQPLPPVPPLSAKSLGVCRITSPWVDIVIERKPVPSVRAIFRYSERQLLTDQAVLAGVRNVPSGVAMPVSYIEFNRYADVEYLSSEILHQSAEKPIEERVPPDLLWLFRRARQEESPGRFSGTAGASMSEAMKAGSESYTKIVISLIDRCFESDGADIQFSNILDLDDPDLFEQYKIDRSIISMPEHGN